MARIQRHRLRSRALCRRSREERRRLSEGGGSAPQPPPPTEQFVPKVEIEKLTEEEIERAYQTVFQLDEEYRNVIIEEAFYQSEIKMLQARKASIDDRLSKLKQKTKEPDSDSIKHIRSGTRKVIELEESIDALKSELSKTCLRKAKVEAVCISSMSIIEHHVANEGEGLFLGCLAYVMMME
ncbi:uncharacterized protein LOC119277932 [Triticum dicoccoides]|uniref:uncharacterized protein LOC119277932 n=1 Tax=Triticum dicoccoides TaxID=85692 RepID=UPI000E78A715|nr:uncharacterized protein LOC119277932 [Triticum dicoccoides]